MEYININHYNKVIGCIVKDYKKIYNITDTQTTKKNLNIVINNKNKVLNDIISNNDKIVRSEYKGFWYKHNDNVYYNKLGDRLVLLNVNKSIHYQTHQLFLEQLLGNVSIDTLYKYRNEQTQQQFTNKTIFNGFITQIKDLINKDIERYGLDTFNKKLEYAKRIGNVYATMVNVSALMFHLYGIDKIDCEKIDGEMKGLTLIFNKQQFNKLKNKFRTFCVYGFKQDTINELAKEQGIVAYKTPNPELYYKHH